MFDLLKLFLQKFLHSSKFFKNKSNKIERFIPEKLRGLESGERIKNELRGKSSAKFVEIEPGVKLWEFRLEEDSPDFAMGAELKADLFNVGQYVDVTGITKGKGFAGTIKRHHFSSQDASHGNSLSHRAPGSIGQRQSPGKVFKGKKMSGHLGNAVRTILSQQVIRIDMERNLILVKGAVPGAANMFIVIRPAIKKSA